MNREELLKDLFAELEGKAYNAEYHNYYYKEANQVIRAFFERTLPPAEGAETILKEGLDDGRYADIVDGINIDVKQPFYQAIIRYAEDVVAAQPQPTAEGAEEYLRSKITDDLTFNAFDIKQAYPIWLLAKWIEEFATLHAQRIAEKMVSERLREELIHYTEHEWSYTPEFCIEIVDEYLKTREK